MPIFKERKEIAINNIYSTVSRQINFISNCFLSDGCFSRYINIKHSINLIRYQVTTFQEDYCIARKISFGDITFTFFRITKKLLEFQELVDFPEFLMLVNLKTCRSSKNSKVLIESQYWNHNDSMQTDRNIKMNLTGTVCTTLQVLNSELKKLLKKLKWDYLFPFMNEYLINID